MWSQTHNRNVTFVTLFSTEVIINVLDANDLPVLLPPFEREIIEGSPHNAIVGDPIEAVEEDEFQSVLFSIVGGNIDDAFRIETCGGQIRVLTPSALDFEGVHGYSEFDLSIQV